MIFNDLKSYCKTTVVDLVNYSFFFLLHQHIKRPFMVFSFLNQRRKIISDSLLKTLAYHFTGLDLSCYKDSWFSYSFRLVY